MDGRCRKGWRRLHLAICMEAQFMLPVVKAFFRDAAFGEPGFCSLPFRAGTAFLDDLFPLGKPNFVRDFVYLASAPLKNY